MNIAFLSDGRDWAYYIAKGLCSIEKKWKISKIVTTPEIFFPNNNLEKLNKNTRIIDPKDLTKIYKEGFFDDIDIMLFYGWSWIVPKEIVENKVCICSHPSPLPKYRGGSPLQHQIINGEKRSAVSLFRMTMGIDDGPIYKQSEFSLEGHLNDIIKRIGETGLKTTIEMLDQLEEKKLKPMEQDGKIATVYKRRKKEESEVTEDKLKNMSAIDFFNFVRALEDPYPNAYIKIGDCIAVLKEVDLEEKPNSKILQPIELKSMKRDEFSCLNFVLGFNDGYVKIKKMIII